MDGDERDDSEARLRLLDLLVLALDHRHEVLDLVETAATPDEAEQRIRTRFGVADPHLSRAVLDLQLTRFTQSERTEIARTGDELRARLHQ